jgi:hypothetical protein
MIFRDETQNFLQCLCCFCFVVVFKQHSVLCTTFILKNENHYADFVCVCVCACVRACLSACVFHFILVNKLIHFYEI